MAKNRTPTMKLSTMRILYGLLAVTFLVSSPVNLMLGNPVLGVVQFVIAGVATWFAISPPAYVRRNFIQ